MRCEKHRQRNRYSLEEKVGCCVGMNMVPFHDNNVGKCHGTFNRFQQFNTFLGVENKRIRSRQKFFHRPDGSLEISKKRFLFLDVDRKFTQLVPKHSPNKPSSAFRRRETKEEVATGSEGANGIGVAGFGSASPCLDGVEGGSVDAAVVAAERAAGEK
jgi:hypothetical protein